MVEATIVIALVGILAAMVLPMFAANDAQKLEAAARVLAADLDHARVESIAHPDDLRLVSFDTTAGTWSVVAASDTATPLTEPFTKQPYTRTPGSGPLVELTGVTVSAVSVGGDDLLGFDAFGGADQASDATITLSLGSASIVVTVDAATGQVSLGPIS